MAQGRDTISQRIAIDGADEVIRQLRQMGAAGEDAIRAIESAVNASQGSTSRLGNLTDSIRAQFSALHAQLTPVKEKFGELAEAGRQFGESLNNTAEHIIPHWREVLALALAGSVAGLVHLVRETANATNEIKKTADEVGLSTDKWQEFNFVMRSVGVEQERVISTFTRLARSVGDAVVLAKEHTLGLASALAGKDISSIVLGNNNTAQFEQRQKEMQHRLTSVFPATQAEIEKAAALLQKATADAFGKAGGDSTQAPGLTYWIGKIRASFTDLSTEGEKTRQMLFKYTDLKVPFLGVAEAIERSKDATKEMDVLFRRVLGVEFQDASGNAKELSVIFDAVGRSLDRMSEAGTKQYYAQLVFNRGFKEVLPIFSHGGQELAALREEWEKMNIAMSDAEILAGQGLFRAFARLNITLENTKSRLILVFAPEINELIEAITGAIQRNAQALIDWARHIRDEMEPGIKELIGLIKGELGSGDIKTEWVKTLVYGLTAIKDVAVGVVYAFRVLLGFMDRIALAINRLFGSEWTGAQLLAVAVVLQLVGAFGLLASAISGIIAVAGLLAALIGAPIALIIGAVAAAAVAILLYWNEIRDGAIAAWGRIKEDAVEAWKFISEATANYVQSWIDMFSNWATTVGGWVDWLINKFKLLLSLMGSTGQQGSGSSPVITQAAGGPVPGSGYGDHVPALLEPGEFIVRRQSVSQVGLGFMHALNQGLMRGFSLGGIAERLTNLSPQPLRLATGGLVAAGAGVSRSAFTLNLDGQSFHAHTDDATARRLVRVARGKALVSAGRKPSWYGG